MKQSTKALLDFIQTSTSPYHTVQTSEKLLQDNGFEGLSLTEDWKLADDGKYYVKILIPPSLPFVPAKPGNGA